MVDLSSFDRKLILIFLFHWRIHNHNMQQQLNWFAHFSAIKTQNFVINCVWCNYVNLSKNHLFNKLDENWAFVLYFWKTLRFSSIVRNKLIFARELKIWKFTLLIQNVIVEGSTATENRATEFSKWKDFRRLF